MDLALANGDLLWLVLALLVGGLATGFLAGLLGIGGGGVLVPVLFETFTFLQVPDGIRMHLVLGTSFAVIVPTAISSFRAHLRKGAVDTDVLRRLAPFVIAGVLVGIVLVSVVSSTALKGVWVVCGFLLALKMALGREDWRLADDVPAPSSRIGGVPSLMDALVATATARDPRDRFADAAEFLAALDDAYRRVYWNVKQEDCPSPFGNNGTSLVTPVFEVHAYSLGDEEQPFNFSWRDLKLRWYKWSGRSVSANMAITPDMAAQCLDECLASIEAMDPDGPEDDAPNFIDLT